MGPDVLVLLVVLFWVGLYAEGNSGGKSGKPGGKPGGKRRR